MRTPKELEQISHFPWYLIDYMNRIGEYIELSKMLDKYSPKTLEDMVLFQLEKMDELPPEIQMKRIVFNLEASIKEYLNSIELNKTSDDMDILKRLDTIWSQLHHYHVSNSKGDDLFKLLDSNLKAIYLHLKQKEVDESSINTMRTVHKENLKTFDILIESTNDGEYKYSLKQIKREYESLINIRWRNKNWKN